MVRFLEVKTLNPLILLGLLKTNHLTNQLTKSRWLGILKIRRDERLQNIKYTVVGIKAEKIPCKRMELRRGRMRPPVFNHQQYTDGGES